LNILIHTSGRATRFRQVTRRHLFGAGIDFSLVVQEREFPLYKAEFPKDKILTLPPHVTDLTSTRDELLKNPFFDDHVVFLDDDLDFAQRRLDDPTKFEEMTPLDFEVMFNEIDEQLKVFPMVGIGAREGGNRNTEEYLFKTRIMRVLGFNRPWLLERGITFAPLKVMEDFHVNLQVLEHGGTTAVCNNWVSNQRGGSDAPGGCSIYRTPEVQTESAHLLQKLHPGVVQVVQKETKTAWGGGTRTDVRIQWKRAFKEKKCA